MVVLNPSSPYRSRTAADGRSEGSRSGGAALSGASPGGRNVNGGSRATVAAVSASSSGSGSGSDRRVSVRRGTPLSTATGPNGQPTQPVNPVPSTNLPAPSNALQEFYAAVLDDARLKDCPNLCSLVKSTTDRIGLAKDHKAYIDALEDEFNAFGGQTITVSSSPVEQMVKAAYYAEKKIAGFLCSAGRVVWDEDKLSTLHRVVRAGVGYQQSLIRDIGVVLVRFYPDVTSSAVAKLMKELRSKSVEGSFNYEAAIAKYGTDLLWTDDLNTKLVNCIGDYKLMEMNDAEIGVLWQRFEDDFRSSVAAEGGIVLLDLTIDDLKCKIRYWQSNFRQFEQARSRAHEVEPIILE